jgi:DNA repair exonuclease SbcCD nuclease subunit
MSYTLGFFADPHIGYRAKVRATEKGINTVVQDGYDAFKEVIVQMMRSDGDDKLDAVVFGGDMFHYSNPNIRDIATVQHWLRQLSKKNIPFYGLAGNHDATDNRSDLAAVAAVHDPDRGIHALYEPYAQYNLTDGLVLHSVSHHGLSGAEAPEVVPVAGAFNLFTTHGAALDPKNQELMRCAGSVREQMIPIEMIIDESFVGKLLGHYHSRYAVGGESLNTWYSGSLVRRGFSDAPGERGWLLVKIDDNGEMTVTPKNIKQRPQYDLDVIDASDLNASDANRGVREGLDRAKINELTQDMLLWKLEYPPTEKEDTKKTSTKSDLSLSTKHSVNVLESYQGWVKEAADSVPEEYRDAVVKDAEEYIKTARENSFGKDGHSH